MEVHKIPRPASIPKYRKHSSWQARVSPNGRDFLLGPHGSRASIREYDRSLAEYLSSGRSVAFGMDAIETAARVGVSRSEKLWLSLGVLFEEIEVEAEVEDPEVLLVDLSTVRELA